MNLKIEEPMKEGFTIYSKSGCPKCRNVKEILLKQQIFFHEIYCDEYLLFERDKFLSFIEEKTGKECKSFPIVFHNGVLLGGFADTEKHLQLNQ